VANTLCCKSPAWADQISSAAARQSERVIQCIMTSCHWDVQATQQPSRWQRHGTAVLLPETCYSERTTFSKLTSYQLPIYKGHCQFSIRPHAMWAEPQLLLMSNGQHAT
jgi:hypothetical protein